MLNVMERIPISLRVIRQLLILLDANLSENEHETTVYYTEELSDLFQALCVTAVEWEDRSDHIVSSSFCLHYYFHGQRLHLYWVFLV